jgi:hypothetical protein
MPGLVPGIHVLRPLKRENVDGRDKPGHDGVLVDAAPMTNSGLAGDGLDASILPMEKSLDVAQAWSASGASGDSWHAQLTEQPQFSCC